jgi:leader peptidase (prepilin peptidase)/N-methyltransferase
VTTAVHIAAAVPAGFFGLAIGSFTGVVVDRVPASRSLVSPPSHCESCGVPIRPYDNIPLVSYILLRGRCRACGAAIPPRAVVIEVLTGALFVLLALRLPSLWSLPAYCAFAAGLVALSAIDIEEHRLPRPVVYWTALLGGGLLLLASAATGRWDAIMEAAIGAGACFAVFFAIFFAVPTGMGFGDVRLAALCGGCLGWLGLQIVPLGMIAAFLLAGIPAVVLLASGKVTRKTKLPFGPYLSLGTLVAVMFGPSITRLATALH